MSKLVLITGGARSGKSSFALDFAESISENRVFVATCPVIDPEMSKRIQRHQEERQGRGWDTIEMELELEAVFQKPLDPDHIIVVDCVTLLINNLLYEHEQKNQEISDEIVANYFNQLIEIIIEKKLRVIFVTNEVGLGIVPENKVARLYRDLVGTANQVLGRGADDVVLVSCGIPHYLKQRNL